MKFADLPPTLARHGVSVSVTPAGTLHLSATVPPPAELIDAIREHKAELLASLTEPLSSPLSVSDNLTATPADLSPLFDTLPAECPKALYLTALTASGYVYGLDWAPPTWPPTLADLEDHMLSVRAYITEAEPRTLKTFNIAPSPVVGWQLEAGPALLARVAPDGYETLGERSTRPSLEQSA